MCIVSEHLKIKSIVLDRLETNDQEFGTLKQLDVQYFHLRSWNSRQLIPEHLILYTKQLKNSECIFWLSVRSDKT